MWITFIWIITAFTLYIGFFWVILALDNKRSLRASRVPTRWPSIDVVIPAYNEEKIIGKCIRSLMDIEYPKKLNIIVVNDGSTDNTEKVVSKIASKFRNVKLITQPNCGKGAALNTGLKYCKSELVAVMDADSWADKDALKEIVGHFEDGEKIGAVVASIKTAQPKRFLTRLQNAEYMISCLYRRLGSLTNTMYVTPGAFSVFQRTALTNVGGFDEHNLTEDMEVALKLHKNGWEIRNSMVAATYTELPDTAKELYRQRIRWYRGLLANTWKYKEMMFNPRYGLLGMWQLPLNIIFPVISLIVIGMFAWFTTLGIYHALLELSIVGFTFDAFSFDRLLLGFDWRVMVPWMLGLSFGLCVLMLSYHQMHERISKNMGRLRAFAFLLVYYTIINLLWCVAFIQNFIRSERKW